MNTLYATDIHNMLARLRRAEGWISKIRADSASNQSHRFQFIREEIDAVRDILLCASCASVAVEQTDAVAMTQSPFTEGDRVRVRNNPHLGVFQVESCEWYEPQPGSAEPYWLCECSGQSCSWRGSVDFLEAA